MFIEKDLKIRKMRAEDIDAVDELEQKIFKNPWSKKEMLKILNEDNLGFSVVAEFIEEIIGYAFSWIVIDGIHIGNIAVKEGFRRLKIGTRLMDYIVNEASNMGGKLFFLEVRKSNESAINLYKKFGFVPLSIKKRYYSDNGEDAVVMIKEVLQQKSQ